MYIAQLFSDDKWRQRRYNYSASTAFTDTGVFRWKSMCKAIDRISWKKKGDIVICRCFVDSKLFPEYIFYTRKLQHICEWSSSKWKFYWIPAVINILTWWISSLCIFIFNWPIAPIINKLEPTEYSAVRSNSSPIPRWSKHIEFFRRLSYFRIKWLRRAEKRAVDICTKDAFVVNINTFRMIDRYENMLKHELFLMNMMRTIEKMDTNIIHLRSFLYFKSCTSLFSGLNCFRAVFLRCSCLPSIGCAIHQKYHQRLCSFLCCRLNMFFMKQ